jgi:hypothetical protein
MTNLTDLATIVEDTSASTETKVFIFMLHKTEAGNKVKLIGISPTITLRRELPESDYQLQLNDEDVDPNTGVRYIAFKSKEILDFLSSYKSLRRTKVDEVIFEPLKNKFKWTIIESHNFSKEELDKINQELSWTPDAPDPREEKFVSSWTFDAVMIQPKRLPNIELPTPEGELEHENGNNELEFLSKSLTPLVENNPSSMFGYMNFDTQYIVAFTKACTAIMANFIPGNTFKGIRLSYAVLSFIDKVISKEENIQFTKTDRHVYFKTDKSEAFVVYDTKLVPYDTQMKLYNPSSMVSIDRIYLKDIIKRFSLANDTIEFTVDVTNGTIKMANSRFTQELSILSSANESEIEEVHFKISPKILDTAIIGDDSTFDRKDMEHGSEIFIYVNKNNRNSVSFGDASKLWFSIVNAPLS